MNNLNYLSLRDLEYVVAVADHGSFVRAARHCRVAPPSLSAQIKKLERGIRIVIFERTTRRVFLTHEGVEFVNQARKVLAEASKLLGIVEHSNLPFGGSLRIAAISTLGPYLFPLVLPQLRQLYPSLRLSLEEGLTHDLVEKLHGGETDGVLLSFPCEEPSLAVEPLFDEEFFLAVPKALSEKEQTIDHELMLLDDGHCLQGQAISACSMLKRGRRHATSLETLKYMVAAGEGVAIVPALAAAPTDPVEYVPVTGVAANRTIALAWRRSDPHGPEFKVLSRALQRIVAPSHAVSLSRYNVA